MSSPSCRGNRPDFRGLITYHHSLNIERNWNTLIELKARRQVIMLMYVLVKTSFLLFVKMSFK